jgi:hypothetical protein
MSSSTSISSSANLSNMFCVSGHFASYGSNSSIVNMGVERKVHLTPALMIF